MQKQAQQRQMHMNNPYHAGFSNQYDGGGRDPFGSSSKNTNVQRKSSSKGFSQGGMNNSQYSNSKGGKPRNQDDALRMLNEMMGKRVHGSQQ